MKAPWEPMFTPRIAYDSGGKGGSQSTFSTTTGSSTNTAAPSPFVQSKMQSLIDGPGGSWDWMGNNWNAPAYFPGGTVAPQSDFTNEALNTTWGFGKAGVQGLDASLAPATGYFTDAANGKFLDIANDPNWQAALAASLRPGTENFRDVVAPGIDSTFAGSGRTAGGAHFDTMMRGVNDLTRNQADASAKAASDRYNQERGYQASAAGAIPGLATTKAQLGSGYTGLMNNVGATRDAYAQRVLEDQNAKYSYDTTGQLDWFNRLSQTLQSMYPGGQTTGQQSGSSSGSGQQQQPGGGVGSFIGPALSVAGMALPFLSDRRDKTDIEELGIDPLTGLKTYAYRYKGEPKNQPKIVGPMAQDIEEVAPHLVREIGGHKVVTMAPGGLL